MKGNRLKVLLILIFLSIFFSPLISQATELPPGIVIGDSQGIKATKNGDFHVNVTDVLPGKTWHTTISMVNMEKDIPYQLTMIISPAVVSGSLDLSKEIQMKLTYEGKIVYEGPASGISETKNLQNSPLDLGVFQAGDSRALEVEYSLSSKFTNQDFEQKNTMDNIWTYSAIKTNKPNEPTGNQTGTGTKKPFGRLPTTGEIKEAMTVFCLGLFLVMTLLLIWKKKQTQTTNINEEE